MKELNVKLNLDEDTIDALLVDILKHNYHQLNHPRYDEGGVYLDSNDEILNHILGVLSWFMIPDEYETFKSQNPIKDEK